MLSTVGIRTRNELRYYKQAGQVALNLPIHRDSRNGTDLMGMPRLRIRVDPKSVKKWKTK